MRWCYPGRHSGLRILILSFPSSIGTIPPITVFRGYSANVFAQTLILQSQVSNAHVAIEKLAYIGDLVMTPNYIVITLNASLLYG